LAARALDDTEFRFFRLRYLSSYDHRRLGMPYGTFLDISDRVAVKLGKAFSETVPYGIYPPRGLNGYLI